MVARKNESTRQASFDKVDKKRLNERSDELASMLRDDLAVTLKPLCVQAAGLEQRLEKMVDYPSMTKSNGETSLSVQHKLYKEYMGSYRSIISILFQAMKTTSKGDGSDKQLSELTDMMRDFQ